jgi:surface protein
MKKIVKGNDFTLKIPVMKMVEGQAQAFPLPACTDVVVQVCNQFRRIPLAFDIDVKEDNVLLARVEGDKMSLGTYAIEVKGKIFGNDWRSNEYPQFVIVANNADADTEFGETDEGDNSVEMDTAMVILPPTVELSDLIDKANEALKNSKETNDTLNENEEARKEAETLRGTAEQGRVSAEEARTSAEGSRTKAEEGRVSAEAERVKAEQARTEIEIERQKNELTRKDDESKRVAAESERVKVEKARTDAESSRAVAETERVDAEAQRVSAEGDRANAETGRVAAEGERVKAEKKRQSDTDAAIQDLNTHRTEFDDAEAARVNAENSRVKAEATRKQAEADRAAAEDARVEAEQSRADAETKRKSDFDTAIKAAETATDGAEKVDANLTDDNVVEITNRNGTTKSVSLDEAVKVGSDVNRIKQTLGAYSDREDVVLTPKETNKAISSDGVKVTKQGWAIAEFTAEKGNEYLFKPNVIDGSVCVFAEYITSIETRGIDYTYTYNEDGTIATATATYLGNTHTYTYEWSVEAGVNTPTIKEGDTIVSNLPMTYETKVGTYSPLVKLNEDAELPIDGYCRYMSHFKGNSSIKIVVSYKVGIADLTMKVLRDGVLASISTQLGNLSQKEDETRKKVEEYHGSYIELLCKTDTIVIVDGKEVTIPAMKRTKVYPKVSYKPKIQALGADKETMSTILLADVSHLDTSNFTSMDSMFRNCYLLTELDVSHFDTSKVTNMSAMFKGCSALTSLNVSGFDTSKVTSMEIVFSESGVQKLDLRGWNVENVLTMTGMFLNCMSLATINLTEWNAIKCTNMGNMFNGCIAIQNIYGLSTLVKAACREMPSFNKLPDIDLDLSGWDTSGLKRFYLAFYRSSLKTIDCSGDGWNNVNVSNWYRFLEGAKQFKLGKNFFNMPLIESITITSYVAKEYLVEGSYDRKSNGLVDLTLNLHSNIKNKLTESDIATMTAKGYVIA